MPEIIRRIITASAGTGKTYRLSLEYINLLLRYRREKISFEEILVITFTRKATSEIRNGVFKHLKSLLAADEKGIELKNNLQAIFNTPVTEVELIYLKEVYQRMLVNKHKLQISTIDSFVHSIFKAVIAPYIGIRDFQIDNEINQKYLPDIYNKIFRDLDDSSSFIKIFETAGKKTIEQYDRLIFSLIQNRWLLELSKEKKMVAEGESAVLADQALKSFREKVRKLVGIVREELRRSEGLEAPAEKYFMADYKKILKASDIEDFLQKLLLLIDDENLLNEQRGYFSKELRFWQSKKIKDEEVQEELENLKEAARQAFCDYAFYRYLLPEERDILTLADHILTEYDRLKMRDRILTYSDIAFYTFKYLYDPKLSLIDPVNGSVSNRFYEYLSSRTRFMLIDEFQDTGIIQHKLLYPIISEIISGYGSKEYGGVIVVGDEKQSIYGWRNGERDLLLNMPGILQSEDSSSLDKTYRSSRFVTDFVNRIFSSVSSELREKGLDWHYRNISAHSTSQEGLLSFNFMNNSNAKAFEAMEKINPYDHFVEFCLKPLLDKQKIDPAESVILARNNSNLREIAQVLEDNGIEYFLESSFSFLQHQSIKPLRHFLRYIAENDVLHLLRFLRSDFCLLPAIDLRKVTLLWKRAKMEKADFHTLLQQEMGNIPLIGKTLTLLKSSRSDDLIALIAGLIKEFNVTGLFPEEHNIKNLHLFLETVSDFLSQNRSDYNKNLPGLLQYLTDNEKNEELQQANIDQINSIQLMTIHKAKGLEFHNVFFYYDLSNRGGTDSGYIQFLYQFNETFTELEECRITYNYDQILQNMGYPLYEKKERKDLLEELNNIYVALTRARANITLYFSFEDKEGIGGFITPSKTEEEQQKINIKRILLNVTIDFLQEKGLEPAEYFPPSGRFIQYELGSVKTSESKITPPLELTFLGSEFIDLQRSKKYSQSDKKVEQFLNLKTVYVEDKHVLYGDLVHYYLSYIKYGEAEEPNYALKRVITQYGNLIPPEKIREIIRKTNSFIEQNKELFSRKWEKILLEQMIFDQYGKDYRIDRMMVNEKEKEILLVDYKTGSIKDEAQLERYKKIVETLPFVKDGNYQVDYKYVMIEL